MRLHYFTVAYFTIGAFYNSIYSGAAVVLAVERIGHVHGLGNSGRIGSRVLVKAKCNYVAFLFGCVLRGGCHMV